MAVAFEDLFRLVDGARMHGDPARRVDEVHIDSRRCGPDSCFVAQRGVERDGHDYVAAALAAGCRALVVANDWWRDSERPEVPEDCSVITAPDTGRLAAPMARLCRGCPDEALTVAGVTGTNGKTTVAFLMRAMLDETVGPCGLLGTIRYETGDATVAAPLTTPDGPALYRLLGEMRESGRTAAALEISSHALSQGRATGLALDVAVLTNLSRDHLDYHGDMERYLAAKIGILELLRNRERSGKAPGALAVNVGDAAFREIDTGGLSTVRFSADASVRADVRVVEARLALTGTRLEVQTPAGNLRLESPLVGSFNVENLTAALAAGIALGLPAADCARALAGVEQVPGRLERFALPNGALAIVDYAHTDDALASVLRTCRELGPKRLLLVCGCGGDRDRGKRPLMGAVAARLADLTWLTSDNPRSEDPARICAQMEAGYLDAVGPADRPQTIIDRREAIETALAEAGPGDMVIIAGKGHEDYQLVGGRRLDLDDRRIVAEWAEKAE